MYKIDTTNYTKKTTTVLGIYIEYVKQNNHLHKDQNKNYLKQILKSIKIKMILNKLF